MVRWRAGLDGSSRGWPRARAGGSPQNCNKSQIAATITVSLESVADDDVPMMCVGGVHFVHHACV